MTYRWVIACILRTDLLNSLEIVIPHRCNLFRLKREVNLYSLSYLLYVGRPLPHVVQCGRSCGECLPALWPFPAVLRDELTNNIKR